MAWHSGKPADNDFLSASVQHIRENFAELEPLQPHVAALLNSRIVDHNLDVSDPPNGHYVRWDNGLQLCFGTAEFSLSITSDVGTSPGWYRNSSQGVTFPASFSRPPENVNLTYFAQSTTAERRMNMVLSVFGIVTGSFSVIGSLPEQITDPFPITFTWHAFGVWK